MTNQALAENRTHAWTPPTQPDANAPALGANVGAKADAERRLRSVLRANAASSGVSGLAMAIAPGLVDDVLGTGQVGWVRLVGLALLPFAAFVGWLSTADRRQLRQHTPGIVAGDVGWVVVSIATVALGWYSGAGVVAVLAMALLVDVFALLQFNAVRHLRRA